MVGMEFASALPGGSHPFKRKEYTILDCILDGFTFYILDLICWAGYQIPNCDCEFRKHWLTKVTSEDVDINRSKEGNPYKFVVLSHYSCEKEGLRMAIETGPLKREGIFFYHKESLYTFGTTPLMCTLIIHLAASVLANYL